MELDIACLLLGPVAAWCWYGLGLEWMWLEWHGGLLPRLAVSLLSGI
jgi:hypothetical protein